MYPFTFIFDRCHFVPPSIFSRENPVVPFLSNSSDSRVSNSFRTTSNKNMKVLIVRGYYKNKHGVIIKSYVSRKNSHKVLTTDGYVTSIKQVYLKCLDRSFWLPYGVPLESIRE